MKWIPKLGTGQVDKVVIRWSLFLHKIVFYENNMIDNLNIFTDNTISVQAAKALECNVQVGF
jgi:hypothetical protein